MKKALKNVLTTLAVTSLLTSCGGGGSSSSLPGSAGDNFSGSGEEYIKIQSLEIQTQSGVETNPLIYPGDVFYIKWKVEHSGHFDYSVAFFATETDVQPTIEDEEYRHFAHTNCISSLTDCSKGLKCHYFKENDNYFIECASYSKIPNLEGWGSYAPRRRIEPTLVNFISADAYMYVYEVGNDTIDIQTIHSTKSVPVTFMP